MLAYLPTLLALGPAALAAAHLAASRRSDVAMLEQRRVASRAFAVAVGLQTLHFGEEAATGLHERLGPLLGLPPMPLAVFLGFNLAWIGVWLVSVPALRSGRPAAFFAAWFLAIAGMINAVAHPLLAFAAGGYFPGLVTFPLIGIACGRLWARLSQATASRGG